MTEYTLTSVQSHAELSVIEATAKEIPLPGKKANEILDFLKQLYVKEKADGTSK